MLDFIGMVTVAALMMLVVNALITFMDVPRVAKITLSRQDVASALARPVDR